MSRLHVLTAGVALAAVVAVSSTAEAGSRRFKPCRSGGWFSYPSANRYYVPSAPRPITATPPAAPAPAPADAGVVRRYSYEPGTEGAIAPAPAPVVRQPSPAYRPSAPAVRSSGGNSGGGFKAGLTGGDRLRPGSRNR